MLVIFIALIKNYNGKYTGRSAGLARSKR